jgi:hypothetical protein
MPAPVDGMAAALSPRGVVDGSVMANSFICYIIFSSRADCQPGSPQVDSTIRRWQAGRDLLTVEPGQ